ncbi:hypothetical protein Goari_026796, partial [Gossypium aridum]|nr:hypothetical protein [Gossypium aridum]
ELKEIWAQWVDEVKQLFYCNYGDLPYLLDIKMDKHLFRALVKFWNSAYSFFTFGKVDLVPTVEEYKALLLLGHIDEAVSDLFDRLDRRVTCVPMILAETFRSLNTFWRT